jgi:uncharacterized protein with HEPN domain
MTHPDRVPEYLEHIVQAIERATRYIEPLDSAEALGRNEQVQDAVVRNIEIIGEAAARIVSVSKEFVASHPELPWTAMRGMRNKMIHEYFDVDWTIVWATIKVDLPQLRQQIRALLLQTRKDV